MSVLCIQILVQDRGSFLLNLYDLCYILFVGCLHRAKFYLSDHRKIVQIILAQYELGPGY